MRIRRYRVLNAETGEVLVHGELNTEIVAEPRTEWTAARYRAEGRTPPPMRWEWDDEEGR